MANDVMTLDQRVSRLEETVTAGFTEVKEEIGELKHRFGGLEGRIGGLEGRMSNLEHGMGALSNKMDVIAESLRSDIRTLLEHVDGLGHEMRRTFAAIRPASHRSSALAMPAAERGRHSPPASRSFRSSPTQVQDLLGACSAPCSPPRCRARRDRPT